MQRQLHGRASGAPPTWAAAGGSSSSRCSRTPSQPAPRQPRRRIITGFQQSKRTASVSGQAQQATQQPATAPQPPSVNGARSRGLKHYQTKRGKSVFSAARSVKFHVRYKTDWGQEVYLVGNCAALGDWDVMKGVQLVWGAGHIWEGSVELPAGMHIQYKYVVRNKDGSVVRWQEGDNVSLELPGGAAEEMALDVEDSWNKSKQVKRILASGTPVRFNIRVKAEFGQLVMVVGSCATLGNWNVEQAVRLNWQEGHIWEAGVDMPAGEVVAYKYVILNADGSVADWQPGDNLTMDVPAAQGNTGRRRGVLVLDTWAKRAANNKPRAARGGSSAGARARGTAASWRSTPYASTPAGLASSGGSGADDVSDASSAAARSFYSLMSPAAGIAEPAQTHQPDPSVMQHWTDKPRFGGSYSPANGQHHEHHDPWRQQQQEQQQQQHEDGEQQAAPRIFVPPPPAGSGTQDYARWQALQSVMSALQHSSELDHWVDDPTDPRMLAADRRLAALTATLGSTAGAMAAVL